MTGTPLLAVKATAKAHYALRHPSGDGLDAHGFGHWPDDAFTERRRQEGAIRIGHDEAPTAAPKHQSGGKSARKASRTEETPDRAPEPDTDAASPPQAEEH